MGLIARSIEAAGIPTLSMSSARSITRSVNPPRAVFLDFPLGHTAGKPSDSALNRRIMIDTLTAFAAIEEPGTILDLRYAWDESDEWKDPETRPPRRGMADDQRVERFDTPQYQSEDDERAAVEAGDCATCVWLEMH